MISLMSVLNAPELPYPFPKNLPCDDGEPMDTPWHRAQMELLIDILASHWEGRKDFYLGGNMFIYFSNRQVFNKDFRGPDFFVVKDVDGDKYRDYWATWEENSRFPNVIVEIMSESTAHIDRTVKKELYDRTFNTPEYYLMDPDTNRFESWQKTRGQYELFPPEPDGMVWSRQLELHFGLWFGDYRTIRDRFWLRFFDVHGNLIPAEREKEEAGRLQAEQNAKVEKSARIKANRKTKVAESARLEADRQASAEKSARIEAELKTKTAIARAAEQTALAEAATAHANAEASARRKTESEMEKLRAEIERLRNNPESPTNQ